MTSTKKPTSGGVDDLRATLRRRHADPSTDTPADDRAEAITGASTDAPAEARADARAHGIAEAPTGGPVDAPDGVAPVGEGDEPGKTPPASLRPSESPRRVLEVKARAYKGGLRRLDGRADALAEAIRGVLAAGGTAGEVRRLLSEIGLETEEIPRQAREALRRR